MGTTPVITALLKSCYVMANQFPRAGREPTAYGSEVARSTNSATAPHTAQTIAASLVHSKLDYCNSLFLNLSHCQLDRLQLILNLF